MEVLLLTTSHMVVAGLITATLIWIFRSYLKKIFLFKTKISFYKLGKRVYKNGITKFHFSRDDYDETLSTFLNKANKSIEIVSVSLKVTNESGNLTELFRRKIIADKNFRVKISVRNPKNRSLMNFSSKSLGISATKLKNEIEEMIEHLHSLYNTLTDLEKHRLIISVHDFIPIGSVIMIDADFDNGIIQFETKLFDSSRNNSFGFQLLKENDFFSKHYVSWQKVLNNSKKIIK